MNKTVYCLNIKLYTDGDFHCDYEHSGLKYDGFEDYTFNMAWENEEIARKESLVILKEMKYKTLSSRDYVKKYINEFFDRAITNIEKGQNSLAYMSGNYEGTEIYFEEVLVNYYLGMKTDNPTELIGEFVKNESIMTPFSEHYLSYLQTLDEQVFAPNGFKLIAVKI